MKIRLTLFPLILLLLIGQRSYSQEFVKVYDKKPSYYESMQETHYDLEGREIRVIQLVGDRRMKDSTLYVYEQGKTENIEIQKAYRKDRFFMAKHTLTEGEKILQEDIYGVISPLVQLPDNYEVERQDIAHKTVTYTYDESDSLVKVIEESERGEEPELVRTYEREGNTTVIRQHMPHGDRKLTAVKKGSMVEMEILDTHDGDTLSFSRQEMYYDDKDLLTRRVSTFRREGGMGKAAPKRVPLGGKSGYQYELTFRNELDEHGNLIHMAIYDRDGNLHQERTMRYQRKE